MASVETFLAPTTAYGLTAQALADAPFVSGKGIIPKIYSATMSAGGNTSIVRTLTAAQVTGRAQVDVIKAAWAGQTYTITLPNPNTIPAGCSVRIEQVSAAAATSPLRVNCTGGALLAGNILNSCTTVPVVVGGAALYSLITFLAASAAGDHVELVSNGTYWIAYGASSVVGFTFA